MKQEMVRDWMTTDPVVVFPDTPVLEAHKTLRENDIRRLPVVDEQGNLVGIVTLGDVREASPSDASSLSMWEMNYLLSKLRVEKIMSAEPLTLFTSDSIARAANMMLEHKVSGLPVIDPDGRLMGIITESDIFRLVVQRWDS